MSKTVWVIEKCNGVESVVIKQGYSALLLDKWIRRKTSNGSNAEYQRRQALPGEDLRQVAWIKTTIKTKV